MKEITIIQPGRIGDILLCLPIAYHYFKQGYIIKWPICDEYQELFDYVNFPIIISDIGSIKSPVNELIENSISKAEGHIFNLAIGFGQKYLNDEWQRTGMSFDQWKYSKAGLPYEFKYKLPECINRNFDKEKDLYNNLYPFLHTYPFRKGPYIAIHCNGSHNRNFNFNMQNLELPYMPIVEFPGYSIFDWLLILENAYSIYCVDSCFANLVDQFQIKPEGGKFFHPWTEYYNLHQLNILTPKLKEWNLI